MIEAGLDRTELLRPARRQPANEEVDDQLIDALRAAAAEDDTPADWYAAPNVLSSLRIW